MPIPTAPLARFFPSSLRASQSLCKLQGYLSPSGLINASNSRIAPAIAIYALPSDPSAPMQLLQCGIPAYILPELPTLAHNLIPIFVQILAPLACVTIFHLVVSSSRDGRCAGCSALPRPGNAARMMPVSWHLLCRSCCWRSRNTYTSLQCG